MNAAVLLVDDDRALRKLVRAYCTRGSVSPPRPPPAAGGVGDATHDSQPEPRWPGRPRRARRAAKLGDAEHPARRDYSEPTAR